MVGGNDEVLRRRAGYAVDWAAAMNHDRRRGPGVVPLDEVHLSILSGHQERPDGQGGGVTLLTANQGKT